MVSFPPAEPRLGAILAAHRSAIADRLADLEWAADTSDPRRLIQGRERVRPRVELFIDSLVAGLAEGDWSLFANAIAAPTGEVLRSGQRSAQQINERALAIITVLIPLVSGVEERDSLLVELFRMMQTLSGGIVASHHEHLLEESRRLNEVKSLFMRLTSHEMRTPLSVTRGYASMLADGGLGHLSDDASDAARYIVRASDASLSLIDGLAEVASLEQDAGLLRVAAVSLADVIERAVGDVLPEATAKSVSIERSVDDGILQIDGDRCAIAVRNLVSNAVKYGHSNAVVRVRASINSLQTEIAVEDDGPGIPDGEREMIFERYYRAASSRTVSGSGLGLYIVRRIAQLHGGDVRVSSRPGRGSCFTLSIPTGVPG